MEEINVNDSGIDFTVPEEEVVEEAPKKKKTRAKAAPEPDVATETKKLEKERKKTAVEPSAEDEDRHNRLVLSAERYLLNPRFKDHLKKLGYKSTGLAKKNNEALEQMIRSMENSIVNRNNDGLSDHIIKAGMYFAETMATNLSGGRVFVQGTTDICFASEQWLDTYECVKLKYLTWSRMDPLSQLALMTLQTAGKVHFAKRAELIQRQQEEQQAQPAPDPLAQLSSDIPPSPPSQPV